MSRIDAPVSTSEGRKNYPIRCVECGKKEVRPAMVARDVERNHDGRVYELHIEDLPVTRCEGCGEVYFTGDSDERMAGALREELVLLTPEQIRGNLEALKLSQKEAAERLGVAAETLSRWLSGAEIGVAGDGQSAAGVFRVCGVREKLSGPGRDRGFGVVAG
jgi:hypothetical protein